MDEKQIRKALGIGNDAPCLNIGKLESDELGKAATALANVKGGYVVCQLDDNAPADIVTELSKLLEEKLVPHTPIFLSRHTVETSQYLLAEVPEGLDKPYAFKSQFFWHQYDTVLLLAQEEISRMLALSSIAPQRWERMLNGNITLDDFDRGELQALRKISNWNDEDELNTLLARFNLQRQGMFTNAATILLCREPGIIHPQVRVRAICCNNVSDDHFKDAKIYDGPALQVIEDLLRFITRNTRNEMHFDNANAQRKDIPEYPMAALREALVNAFAHRDYARYEGGIRVQLLSDRISIWNAGTFPEGISLKRLKQGYVSILRNPDIARYFYERKYMEMTGRGMKLITDECKKNGLRSPKWQYDSLGVTLTIYAVKEVKKPELKPELKPEFKPGLDDLKSPHFKPGLDDPLLSPFAMKILRCIQQHPCSKHELAAYLSQKEISGALKEVIKLLGKDLKYIEWTIPDKPTSRNQRYQLTAKGEEFLRQETPL